MSLIFKYLNCGNSAITEKILRTLPDWFGIEEATRDYIQNSAELPMVTAIENDLPVGFISLKTHSPYTSEIYVMGIAPNHHRRGIGQKLLLECERILALNKTEFLQVKTLDESRENEAYKKTRLFYKSMGFREVEVFPTLWGEANPCLLLIKTIKSS